MSNSDERIVQMQFDNKQFEKNAEASMETLARLKKSLNLDESAKSLANLDRAAKSFSLEGMGKSIDSISDRLSTLGVMGMTVIANLTNSALNFGKKVISSFTLDPIKTGLSEYETKMDAIQTMMTNGASRGTTLDQINEGLAELNDYSDKTIYNFAQMTDNVGKFMAADISLDDSITAIKGLSNVAAGFGVDATKMAGATYQMSQALSTGVIQLMDWKSMEQAGMGGPMLQKELIATAKAMGIHVNETVKFRDSLKDGWLTSEVFIKAMAKMAKDPSLMAAAQNVTTFTKLVGVMKETVQSGWAVSWEKIFGNKEESTQLFTSISNAFSSVTGASSDARNAVLAFWSANGGRQALIEGIGHALFGVGQLLGPIEEAFRNVFPPITGERLVELTKNFRDLMSGFKMGDDTVANIRKTFQGLFALLDIGGKAFTFIAKCIGLVVKALAPGAGGLLSVTGGLGDFLVALNDSLEKSNFFGVALTKVGDGINIVSDAITKAVSFMSGKFKAAYTTLEPVLTYTKEILGTWSTSWGDAIKNTTLFSDAITLIKDSFSTAAEKLLLIFDSIFGVSTAFGATRFSEVANESDKLSTSFSGLHSVIKKIGNVISKVAKTVNDVLGPAIKWLVSALDDLTLQDVGALLTGGGFILFAKTLSDGLGSVNDILDSFSGVLDQVGKTLKAFQLQVKARALLQVAIALGILAASIVVLSLIDGEELARSLGALAISFGVLVAGLVVMNKMIKDVKKITGQLLALGAAMLLLAVSVKVLSSIEPAALLQSTIAMASLIVIIGLFVNSTNEGDLKKSAGGLTSFAIGITILCGALTILGSLGEDKLTQGISSIAALIGVIGVFVKLTNGGDLKKSANGMVGFAVGITILVGALAILGNLDYNQLVQGGTAIAVLIALVAGFVNITNEGDLKKSAGGLIGFAVGITILVGALAILGNLNIDKLIQGGGAIAALMLGIAEFVRVTSEGDLAKSSGGMIAFAAGLIILTQAVSILAKLDLPKLIQGVGAIGVLMIAIAEFVRITNGGDLAKSSAGIIGFSIGIGILSGAIALLASLDVEKVKQSFLVIAGLMSVMGVFIKMTRGGDLTATSAGMVGFATGIIMLAGAVAILSALNQEKLLASTAVISSLILTIGIFVTLTKGGGLAKGAVGLIGFAVAIGVLVLAMLPLAQLDTTQLLSAGAAITLLMIGFAAFTKLVNPANLLASGAALLVMSAGIMVLSVALSSLSGMDFNTMLIGFAALAATFVILGLSSVVLAPLLPVVLGLSAAIAILGVGLLSIGAGVALFVAGISAIVAGGKPFVQAMTEIINLIPLIASKIGEGVVLFAAAITNGMPRLIQAAMAIADGLVNVFINIVPKVASAAIKMVLTLLQTLEENTPTIVDTGLKLLIGFLRGISDNIQQVVEVAADLVVAFLKGVANKLPAIIEVGVNIVVAIMGGIGKAAPRLIKAGFQMVIDFINGLADSIREKTPDLVDAFLNLGDAVIDGLVISLMKGVKAGANAIKNVGSAIIGGFKKLFGINSPSKVFSDFGGHIVSGLANGITDNAKKAVDGIKDLGTAILDKARNVLGIHSPSTLFKEMGLNLIRGMAGGITDNKDIAVDASADMSKDVTKASSDVVKKSNEASKKAFDKAVEWIDERKYYNKLSLEEELAEWKKLQQEYGKDTEERKRADREIYRVKNEIQKAAYDAEIARINDLKYYNKLTLSEELQEWQSMQAKYAEGTEERKAADKEVFRVYNELVEKRKTIDENYYAKVKELNEKAVQDIKALNDALDSAISSRENSLYSTFNLFDDVDPSEAVSSWTLNKNLEHQVKAFEDWAIQIQTLANKGVNDGLIQELKEMGPSSIAQIQALNTMTQPELDKYAQLWETKHQHAKMLAIGELTDLRVETWNKISEIESDTRTQLDTLKTTWSTELSALGTRSSEQLDELSKTFATKTDGLVTETNAKFTGMVSSIKAIDWPSVGVNIIDGMRAGINSQANALAKTTADVALQALKSAKKALGIKSPSKEFAKVGMYADKGFAGGLMDYSGDVESSAENVGLSALSIMQKSISKVFDLVNSNIDASPTIRPVLDLSSVLSGSEEIGSLLGRKQTINVASSIRRATDTASWMQHDNDNSEQTKELLVSKPISFVQNNYSPKPLSRIEIYRQTKNQISTLKGLV